MNTENGDARIFLNEQLSCKIVANFLEILAPFHTWRFNVFCFEVLDANKVRFQLKKRRSCCEVCIRNRHFENRDLAHAQTFAHVLDERMKQARTLIPSSHGLR